MSFDPRVVDMIMRLRSRGISDATTLRAMEQVARAPFMGPDNHARAYEEATLPIACGQTANPPLATALMVQMLGTQSEDKALVIGSGSGWLPAILSRQCRRVYAVERYVGLVEHAETVLRQQGLHNVEIRHGDGRYGWPGQAPFTRIVFGCAVRAVPDKVMDQLGPNGRLLAVVDGVLTQFDRARKHLFETEILPMELPMIEAGKSRTL